MPLSEKTKLNIQQSSGGYYSAPHCQDTKIKIIRMLPLSEQFIFSSLFISGS